MASYIDFQCKNCDGLFRITVMKGFIDDDCILCPLCGENNCDYMTDEQEERFEDAI